MPILDPFEDVVQFHRPRGFESKFHMYLAVGHNIPSGAFSNVIFDTINYDSLGECTLGALNSYFSPVQSGYYHFYGKATINNVGVGIQFGVSMDTTYGALSNYMDYSPIVAGVVYPQVSLTYFLNAGDFVRLQAQQNTGGARALIAGIPYTSLYGHRIA